jgi:hypothetical protein
MKTEIFSYAIHNRNQIRFLYGLNEILMEPYYISREKSGKKFIYGRISGSNEVKRFNYENIVNIKVLSRVKFSPIIPIIS